MTYNIISTGSKGNAVIINNEILIDCGVPFKKLSPFIKPLKLVLLTHIHGDHFKSAVVRALHQERPALRFGCCEWMLPSLVEAGVDKHKIDVLYPDIEFVYSTFKVEPVALFHNVPNCGYKITDAEDQHLFYATDTGTLDGIEAKNYDLYMIEANHTKAELEARMKAKLDAGEFSYERAAAQNHLSRERAEEWLYWNMGPNSRYVFLHQHKEETNAEPHCFNGTPHPGSGASSYR